MLGETLRYGLDTTVSPCDDFYQFVNGGWRDKTVISPNSNRQRFEFFSDTYRRTVKLLQQVIDSAHTIREQTNDPALRLVGTFYESCLVVDTLEPSVRQVRRAGSRLRDSTRQEQCLRRTVSAVGPALGQILATTIFSDNKGEDLREILESLRTFARERVQANHWMTDLERETAIKSLEKLSLRVGMPEHPLDFSTLTLSPTDYHENKLAIANFRNQRWISSIKEDHSKLWKASLLHPNAFYIPSDHAIEIPAVMFMPPFFMGGDDDATNYGAIGIVIAHEIVHSMSGHLRLLNSPDIKENVSRLQNMYTGMKTVDAWTPNGTRTFNEDIADVGGIRIAYNAWKTMSKGKTPKVIDGFTPEQRFFVSMGRVWRGKWTIMTANNTDVHSPFFARVNGMAMYMPEFKDAFGCKEGDPMVLPQEKRPVIW